MKIEKASIIFQINGKCYAALTKDLDLQLLVNVMAMAYESGQVKMVELPEDVHFEKFESPLKSNPT